MLSIIFQNSSYQVESKDFVWYNMENTIECCINKRTQHSTNVDSNNKLYHMQRFISRVNEKNHFLLVLD